jgi:hypothetical protein
MGMFSQLVYNGTTPQRKLDICHLHGLGAAYPKMYYVHPSLQNDS